ncbi:MAG: MFS transporter [Treponema sp.]|jgi:MFS family permease|nr:MFS transporter [Treponema sp.]
MPDSLSPYRLGKARSLYNVFNVFNAFSYTLLAGSLITILAIRMEASSTVIGILSSFVYVAYFFLPIGKILARLLSIISVYCWTWILRSLTMSPFIIAPFVFQSGHRDLALGLMVLGTFCFHLNRGIGMIGNNPVLDELASGPDRGSYMTLIQIINAGLGMLTNLAVAMLFSFWQDPPLVLYAILTVIGIISGVISGLMIKKLPEPETDKNAKKVNFGNMLKESFSDAPFRKFMTILFMIALASGVARIFAVVYCREVFHQSDSMVVLYTVFGGFGQLSVGFATKFLVDRIGVKPLFIICTVFGLVSMLPIVLLPVSIIDNAAVAVVFLIILLFMLNFGFLGAEGIAQTYFLGLIPAKYMLDMGIVYFICFGIAGAGGSFVAGLFLDTFTGLGFSSFATFKFLYLVLIVIIGVVLALQRKLVRLGSLSFKNALEVIFSFRDLRAITLLDKLSKTNDSQEEEAILDALHDTPSQLAITGLLDKAQSPRLSTRLEALRAMETLSALSEEAEHALIQDLLNHPYTTAYISARILGTHNASAALPVLRELAASQDYMLAGEAIIALARMEDHAFRPQIEDIIIKTENPRLKLMGVEAFGIYKSVYSLSVLLDILRSANPPPYLCDGVALAMADILGLHRFYPLLLKFLANEAPSPVLAIDEAESATERYRAVHRGRHLKMGASLKKEARLAAGNHQAKTLLPAVKAFMLEKKPDLLSRWILELPETTNPIAQSIFAEAIFDDELNGYERLKLLIVHWASRELRNWDKKEAE